MQNGKAMGMVMLNDALFELVKKVLSNRATLISKPWINRILN
ncbi:MAG: hypothetical protein ABI686_08465 [Acidobacteriota bacterium]